MVKRGLREFPKEADQMMDVIAYPFGYTAVLAGEAFAAIDNLHEHIVHDELVVGGVPIVVRNYTNIPQ